jgi:phage/plasmid-associated DNA primase
MNKKIMIFLGQYNGKSTLINFFTEKNNISHIDLNNRFALQDLLGCDYHISEGKIPNKDILKKIVAGEKLLVERKYRSPIEHRFDNIKFIINLPDEEVKVPDDIKRLAYIYKLNIK